jgi:lantibiotic modifying enzyme
MNRGSSEFLEVVNAIGAGLVRDALWDGARCNWLGDVMELVLGSWQVVHRSFGPEFYGGTSGVALFLARLHQATGEKLFRLTAEGAVEQCVSRIETATPVSRLAYYAGWAGTAHALIQIGEALDRPDFSDRGFAILELSVREEPAPNMLDVIGGIGGMIPPLLAIHSRYDRPCLFDGAVRLGERLVEVANKSDAGWSWPTIAPTPGKTHPDLTGFSHGTAGVAWALCELHRATGREEFLEAARQGLRYEQSWFQTAYENWPDFRNDPTPGADGKPQYACAMAWCHGAPGIALGRLRMYQLTHDEEIRKQAETAVRSTARSLSAPVTGESFCLCHGSGGNAEALIYAAEVLEDESHLESARNVGMRGVQIYHRGGLSWPCGVMGGGENPSLLIGTAGVGYFYLRLFDPAQFPSVLIVHPK